MKAIILKKNKKAKWLFIRVKATKNELYRIRNKGKTTSPQFFFSDHPLILKAINWKSS